MGDKSVHRKCIVSSRGLALRPERMLQTAFSRVRLGDDVLNANQERAMVEMLAKQI